MLSIKPGRFTSLGCEVQAAIPEPSGNSAQPFPRKTHLNNGRSSAIFRASISLAGMRFHNSKRCEMKIIQWRGSWLALSAVALCLGAGAKAQQLPHAIVHSTSSAAYDVARETVLSGKVVEYAATSKTAPMGAHITLQTSSGTVDVHAGNPKVLSANNVSLQAGDSVSITGENVAFGGKTVFVARTIQKGMQSVAVRSKNGTPLRPVSHSAGERIVSPGGVR
jgi:hypothetical protein